MLHSPFAQNRSCIAAHSSQAPIHRLRIPVRYNKQGAKVYNVDNNAARQSYQNKEISNIDFVELNDDLADHFT